MNCETCPIKKECRKWLKQAVKEKLFKEEDIEDFCPLEHGAIIGLVAYLGERQMLDIIFPAEDSEE